MTEKQQREMMRLLKRAWITVDYFNHKGDLSLEIQNLVHDVEGNSEWPRRRNNTCALSVG